jgi:hypothetical protein
MVKLDPAQIRARFPSIDMGLDDWVDYLSTPAGFDSMGKMFYDIFNEMKTIEERKAGIKRQGRRPARPSAPLDEVWRYVLPSQWCYDPLPGALAELVSRVGTQSEFAALVPCSRSFLNNVLAGRKGADRRTLERFATVGGVRPWYFVEWRARYFGDLITAAFTRSPHLAITAVKAAQAAGRLAVPEG